MKTTEELEVGAHSLARSTFGVEGHAGTPGGTRKSDKHLFTHTDLHKTKQQVG